MTRSANRGPWTFDFLRARDGTKLRYGLSRGETSRRHYLVILGGRSEWIEKYHHLSRDLELGDGCNLISWDHRGQGGSGGPRAHVASYDDYIQDGQQILEHCLPADSTYSIIAHSMGGLIALYGTLKGIFRPQQLILSSPLLRLPNQPVDRRIYLPLSRLACRLSLSEESLGLGGDEASFVGNRLTHWPEGFELVKNSPYPIPAPSFGWISASDQAIKFVHRSSAIKKLICPVLILGGSQEAVVDHSGFSTWLRTAHKVSQQACRFQNLPGARHEIFNEIDRIKTLAKNHIHNWLREIHLEHTIL